MSIKILNWNVNGYRSVWQKGFRDTIVFHAPDVFCLQEVKCNDLSVFDDTILPLGYQYVVNYADKPGYSGVLTAWRQDKSDVLPIDDMLKLSQYPLPPLFDTEGRVVGIHISNMLLLNLYIPSGSSGEDRQQEKYKSMRALTEFLLGMNQETRSRLVLCGDFNICHQELDIHHPKEATKKELSGFLPPEREWFGSILELGLRDVFRHMNPEKREYTWWSFRANSRAKNLGWRLDYFLVGTSILPQISSMQQCTNIFGSDHCPIILEVK